MPMGMDIGASASTSTSAQGGNIASGDFNVGGGKSNTTLFIVVGVVVAVLGLGFFLSRRK